MKIEKSYDDKKITATVSKEELSELVIKEVMFQKKVGREKAVELLTNPTPHKEDAS